MRTLLAFASSQLLTHAQLPKTGTRTLALADALTLTAVTPLADQSEMRLASGTRTLATASASLRLAPLTRDGT